MARLTIAFLAVLASVAYAEYGPETLTTSFPQKKTWFAKKITDDIFTGGRPTVRQTKYLTEEGFKSIITVFDFATSTTMGDADVPSTAEEEAIVLDGPASSESFEFHKLQPPASWPITEASAKTDVANLKALIAAAPKPVYIHCGTGFVATFFTALALFPEEPSRINAIEGQFQFGWFKNPGEKAAYKALTGAEAPTPSTLTSDFDRSKYYSAKRLSKHFDIAGQINKDDLKAIKNAGYKAIINTRKGAVHGGKNGKEETTNLNVRHFALGSPPTRSSATNMRDNLVFPDAPASYISPDSNVNYELINEQEFADAEGYNEDFEAKAAADAGIDYYHFPIGGADDYTEAWFTSTSSDTGTDDSVKDKSPQQVLNELIQAGKTPILVHCRTAYRATFLAELFNVHTLKMAPADAVEAANLIGYGFPTEQGESNHAKRFTNVLYNIGSVVASDDTKADTPPAPATSLDSTPTTAGAAALGCSLSLVLTAVGALLFR